MSRRTYLFMSLVLAVTVAPEAEAEERRVPTPDYPTIQAAINACLNDDVVVIEPGTYTGTDNRDMDFLGKAITIRSTDPNDPNIVAATIIDCQGSEAENHRGFTLRQNEGPNSVLAGLTISNGYISGDLFGGWPNGDPNEGYGGAIRCRYTKPTITHCILRGNRAAIGGGIGISSILSAGGPTIAYCHISGNAGFLGGGIASWGADTLITNCTITGNWATGYYWYVFTLLDGWGGGGILIGEEQTLSKITNCTIVGNSTGAVGGGVSCLGMWQSITVLTNCVLWGNTAAMAGSQLSLAGDIGYDPGATANVSYCDIAGGEAAVHRGKTTTLNWGLGNIDSDPQFRDPNGPDGDPNAWQDNDYHLTPNSPCVDTGDPNEDYTGQTDLDGKPRVMGAEVDMGSDEYPRPPYYYQLELGFINGNRGTVAIDPNDPTLPPFVYAAGTVVALTATPFEGKSFDRWEIFDPNYPDDGNHVTVDANITATICMETDMHVNVVWKCGSGLGWPILVALALLGPFIWVKRPA